MTLTQTADVMLCCNDPANGAFDGKLHGVHFEMAGEEIHLACRFADWSPRLVYGPDWVRVGKGRRFGIVPGSYLEWVGNWCWDGVKMEEAEAMKFLVFLARSGWFTFESGTQGLAKLWSKEQP